MKYQSFVIPIVDTGSNFPLVSTTPVANCIRYQRHRRQIATGVKDTCGEQWEQLSDCWQLKMNLKKKII